MLKNLLIKTQARPELIVLCLMVLVIAMLIVPLPPYVLDFLIGFNIVTALLVFMGSFYIANILDFSTFPSILLITTLFRLALSISTSRMILLTAEGGKIITTFGQFVIGDNLVVGFVVFVIVTIVQFIVITKGSERVAEVAARFSLDAMPGKQMSIDADLRAGVIDNEGVKARRSALERESQLYGSFDGAMKFIKGDAIAGIIVIVVNLIGGISVGVAQHGMTISDALTTYTILSIGDGLVAQIPALLIAIGAGFVVTRVSGSGTNLGASIVGELFSNPFVLLVTAVLALALGLLPGFPFIVFFLMALALGMLYVRREWRKRGESSASEGGFVGKVTGALTGSGSAKLSTSDVTVDIDIEKLIPETVPLMLMVPEAVKPIFEQDDVIGAFRRRAFVDMGLRLPDIHVSYSPQMHPREAIVQINEIRAATFAICFDRHRVIGSTLALEGLSLDVVQLPDGAGGDALWVSSSQTDALAKMDVLTRSATDDLYGQFLAVMLSNVTEFFGVQEAKRLLDDMEKKYPELIKESYRHISVQRIAEVFQRLLTEKISIRNMKLVLESLAQWGPREKDSILLVEHVRAALARYITNRFAAGGKLRALVLSAEFEDTVSKGVRQTSGGAYLNLEPAMSEQLLDRLALELARAGFSQRDMVLLASMEVRRFVKRLIESRFPELEVLSFAEVADSVAIDVLKTI
ncbi:MULTISPECIES: EscV/YscV/HrcV family type III secretion system export apparatus protein [Burkholderia]|uniref:EscV/YscV/HrcV family type III secretion system export apparatus protein n=1 Tax=Burkholderia TaxID=32008 RepID=UPI0007575EBB|nr:MULTISPECIES: EscV/YscV/HrcV family type III secretion system export apparatus protein [Burkholderia]AOJ73542.1 type III secretion system protein InvA [Burkholderia savannae]KVG38915.1 type III secretion system protein InvA [Burkholderia sp. MSMB0265]KVG81641.1 type III secretion system protein InvA [Burkholderia sp. MSMB2040]KVG98798.1 type III secretion system protein InvA [Burkholderia sp. MSMB2042]KVG98979.1 type III secretion system protein InvA [Burkholderia sp. MSMB2041]